MYTSRNIFKKNTLRGETNKVGDHPMLARLLSDSGYRTGLFGKWHIASSQENSAQHGFGEIWCGSIPKIKDFDDQVADRTIQFTGKKDDRPFFAVASFINPHNICEMARGNKKKEISFPNYELVSYPEVGECPPLPVNFEIQENEGGYVYSKGIIREQLFHMESDPGETINLVVDNDHRETVKNHRRILKKWCVKTKDDFNCIGENE